MKRYAPLLCAAVVLACASAARAQDAGYANEPVPAGQNTTYEAPAHISLVEGAASLERDGRTDTAPSSMPLLAGDRVRTQVGRVEVLFVDGSTLHLDHHTTVDFQSDEVVRLLSGRVRLNIPGASRDVEYRVDAPGAWVQVTYPGEYRVAIVSDDEVELAVLRGAAELVNEDGRRELRAGERAFARAGSAPSLAYVFNSASWDAFDRWSEGRRDERLGLSTQYLPNEVRPYASTFDRYGSWHHEPSHGYVWYPRVDVGWRPYYRGRWTTLRPYGWTWVGIDPWAWPTHHYGRWGFSAGAWFWIPGRHWGPAWVSWAYAPGYVSWCPLGWNNRPVISFVNINVFRGHRGRYYDHWNAWTVVPRRHFGTTVVNAHVVHGSRIDGRARSAFVVRDRGPEITGFAVPRAAAPIRTAGRRVGTAVPRGTAVSSTEMRTGRDPSPRSVERGDVPFRSQRPGVGSTGPGFPAASRAPRATPDVTMPSRTPSDVVPRARDAAPGATNRGVMPRREGTPYDPGPARRVVPRDRARRGDVDAPSPRAEPNGAPAYAAPAARPRVTDREMNQPAGPRSQPMPRQGDHPAYAPRERTPYRAPAYGSPDGGRERYRSAPPAPAPMPDRPRATPRGADAPAYGPRPSPRTERAAPPPNYGPPPQRERAAPSGRQAEPAGRPRGGDSSGTAVRRPRGN